MNGECFDDNEKEYVITEMFPRRKWLNYLWNDTSVCACDQFGFGTSWSVINGNRRDELKAAVQKYGADGDHLLYGYNDYDEKIGADENEYAKIDLNPQPEKRRQRRRTLRIQQYVYRS